ncbi:hypothetical protein DDW02_00310 [Acidilobus sp. SCGC AC-742_M05]|jgi:DNA-binding transcriptional ArsR family regulator|nr:MAG: hypothetical protein MGAcid_02380 [uncultured Acidilobus sp. MG]PVU69041.1 hypothetical protein DDW02_00310 [Acidilobus sp. SCGC AC-742_M05]
MSEAGGNGDPVRESLSRIYEDNDVIVYTAPNEDELKEILLNLLRRNGRMSVKDFHRYLSGLASEDKIRYALSDLLRRELVTMDRQGYFYLTELLEEEGLEQPEEYWEGEEIGSDDLENF